jgi:hypothetical protein
MDPTELRQMVKHQQCIVIIDSQPPIKAGYPPLAVSRQRALAVDYGEPKLVTLLQGEEAYLTVLAAKIKDELDAQRATGVVATDGIPPLVPETVDTGANPNGQTSLPATSVVSSVVNAAGGEAKARRSAVPDSQGTLLFPDQVVEESLVSAAKVVIGAKDRSSAIRTVTVRKASVGPVTDELLVSSAATGGGNDVQHDALR